MSTINGFGAGQVGGVAFGAEPAVALHGIALARDDGLSLIGINILSFENSVKVQNLMKK